jgi:putative endonuclease
MVEPLHAIGKAGEEEALRYLSQQGYRILERNYRCRFGEIDLIARDGKTLVFIEVKTRRSQRFGPAAASVTLVKQHHLIKAAQVYLARTRQTDALCRFDVVTIDIDTQKSRIELIRDAFQYPCE